jgi:hypothetical protein
MVAKDPEYTAFEGFKLDPREFDRFGLVGSATITQIAKASAELRGPGAKANRGDAIRRMMTWAVSGPHPMPLDFMVDVADQVPLARPRKRPPATIKPQLTDVDRLARRLERRAARVRRPRVEVPE